MFLLPLMGQQVGGTCERMAWLAASSVEEDGGMDSSRVRKAVARAVPARELDRQPDDTVTVRKRPG